MPKIITAKDILKSKGFSINRFNTNAFIQCVGEWFADREVSSVLIIESKRFVDPPNTVNGDVESLWSFALNNPTMKAAKMLFKYPMWLALTDKEKSDGFRGLDYADRIDESIGKKMKDSVREYYANRIFVNSPYFSNSIAALQVMCGYTVKRHRGGKYSNEWAEISLV